MPTTRKTNESFSTRGSPRANSLNDGRLQITPRPRGWYPRGPPGLVSQRHGDGGVAVPPAGGPTEKPHGAQCFEPGFAPDVGDVDAPVFGFDDELRTQRVRRMLPPRRDALGGLRRRVRSGRVSGFGIKRACSSLSMRPGRFVNRASAAVLPRAVRDRTRLDCSHIASCRGAGRRRAATKPRRSDPKISMTSPR
ncbi:MAG: hypothetical protein ACI91Q_001842 [Gammaproteobacteria bacterium]|jgi:hypothetical protein